MNQCKKILLINTNRLKKPSPVIPIGLISVASSLEERGHNVRVLDLCFENKVNLSIEHAVTNFDPDIVGLSIRNIDTSSGFAPVFLLGEIKETMVLPLKKLFQGPIVIGGTAVGVSGREMLEYFNLSYGIKGDGEAAFIEFVENVENQEKLSKISGIIIKNGNDQIVDNPISDYTPLNKLPFPSPYKFISLKQYRKYNSPVQIQTKRGCSLSCVYCVYSKIEGKAYRLRDPETIADEVSDLAHRGFKNIEIVDSTFNVPLNHAKNVLKHLINRKLKLRISLAGLNPGAIDEEFVGLMKKAGIRTVGVGAEAGCDIMLKNLGKNFNVEDLYKTSRLLHKYKFFVEWYMLLGGPGETRETLEKTLSTIKKVANSWDFIIIGVGIRVYNGAPISKFLIESKHPAFKDNFFQPVAFKPDALTLKEIKSITIELTKDDANIVMYDDSLSAPVFIRQIFRMFAPGKPLWLAYIVKRKIDAWRKK